MPKVVDFLLQCPQTRSTPYSAATSSLCSENPQGRCHLSKARKETGVCRLLSSDTSWWRYGMSLQAVLGGVVGVHKFLWKRRILTPEMLEPPPSSWKLTVLNPKSWNYQYILVLPLSLAGVIQQRGNQWRNAFLPIWDKSAYILPLLCDGGLIRK